MYSALDIANFFIEKGGKEDCPITNLKLQKLLYYSQGWALGIMGTPIFQEDFAAWDYGPVCPPIYNKFKQNGANPIKSQQMSLPVIDNENVIKFLNRVWDKYGKINANQLSRMTHLEDPWLETERFETIDKELIRDYFVGLKGGE